MYIEVCPISSLLGQANVFTQLGQLIVADLRLALQGLTVAFQRLYHLFEVPFLLSQGIEPPLS